jgi:hypothetical protein
MVNVGRRVFILNSFLSIVREQPKRLSTVKINLILAALATHSVWLQYRRNNEFRCAQRPQRVGCGGNSWDAAAAGRDNDRNAAEGCIGRDRVDGSAVA